VTPEEEMQLKRRMGEILSDLRYIGEDVAVFSRLLNTLASELEEGKITPAIAAWSLRRYAAALHLQEKKAQDV
jgi:hypothetical protein